MSQDAIRWTDLLKRSKNRGFLATQFFAIFTIPVKGPAEIEGKLAEHLKFQVELDDCGIMFAAGPLCDVETATWKGRGLIVVRAADMEEAKAIAEADPMHSSGVRRYEIVPWLVNEGSVDLRVKYSKGSFEMLPAHRKLEWPKK
jgi:uncharacterized protein